MEKRSRNCARWAVRYHNSKRCNLLSESIHIFRKRGRSLSCRIYLITYARFSSARGPLVGVTFRHL